MNPPPVVVVGGGHAGAEAALAARRMGVRAVLVTFDLARIGEMSCNPAVGGVAKGTLVAEIDALGGAMGECADGSAVQFRMLNRRKGPAVWGPRVQSDAARYSGLVRRSLEEAGVELVEAEAAGLEGPTGKLTGVRLADGPVIPAGSVVVAAGTFLRGMLYRGRQSWRGGRLGDMSSESLAGDLEARGFALDRFKTGTPPRLSGSTVDYGMLDLQREDGPGFTFSCRGRRYPAPERRMACWTTRTGPSTRAAALAALGRSPLYSGAISGRGPRYCPSFEDKVVRFPEREEHPVFLEPMGEGSPLVYLNGLSTSLPEDAQLSMVRSLPGCALAAVARWGYAVEYGYLPRGSFDTALRAAGSENLFFAGQVCGTSGYEEAAALGLLAGRNAAAQVLGMPPAEMDPSCSYLGVMVSDITGRGLTEPYRLFSSRAANRLHLRPDNAAARCLPVSIGMGTSRAGDTEILERATEAMSAARRALAESSAGGGRLIDLCRRPGFGPAEALAERPELSGLDPSALETVILDEKYRGYVGKAVRRLEANRRLSGLPLGAEVDYASVEEISWEAREALSRARPASLGEAAGLPGVRPSDIDGLIIHLSRKRSVPRGTCD